MTPTLLLVLALFGLMAVWGDWRESRDHNALTVHDAEEDQA